MPADPKASPAANDITTPPAERTFGLQSLWLLVEGQPLEPATDPLLGMTVGGVRLLRLIAEGGMGRVYEGIQDTPRRAVALKVLRPGLLARGSIRRFLRETEILGRLQHPGITQVYSAGTFEIAGTQLPYFVMELIPAALPITQYARERGLSISERLDLFCLACDAVAHAHARGVVHRDLKPSNMLVDAEGRPKVIDFGIASGNVEFAEHFTMTATGQLLGTVQYMSPEQSEGNNAVEARSDVYSLGMVLHELVTGQLPYDVRGESLIGAARIIQERRPLRIRSLEGDAPPGLALVMEQSLEKDPTRRFADAAALTEAVRLNRQNGPVTSTFALRRQLLIYRIKRVPLRRWIVAGALGSVIIGGAAWGLTRLNKTHASGATEPSVIVPSLTAATKTFRYSFTSVLDADADRYLVEAVGMQKWNDPSEEPRVSYWGPSQDGEEGRLVYRIQFPGRTALIHITADSQCWDFLKHPGGVGRGVSSIEASRDGTKWITLRDNITHPNWGASWEIHEPMPSDLLGTNELWIRLRFLTENADLSRGYTVAQFARSLNDRDEEVFAIEANCEPND